MPTARSATAAVLACVALAGCASGQVDALVDVRGEAEPTMLAAAPEVVAYAPQAPRQQSAQTEATREDELSARADEVMTVFEKRLETADSRRDIYRMVAKGKRLFAQNQIDEAFPYLLDTAELGFKGSQARVGHIYLQGLGEIERDTVQGVGWLGVASSGPTSPGIRNYFNDIWKRIPDAHVPYFEEVVDDFKNRYGERTTGVICELDRPVRSFLKELACFFEAPLPEEIRAVLEEYEDDERAIERFQERWLEAQRVMQEEACRNPVTGASAGCR